MQEIKAKVLLCVVGIVFKEDKFLMLKRKSPCDYWVPPCGGVRKGENIIDAIHREIFEEACLKVDVLKLVDTWQGVHDGEDVFSVTYLCKAHKNGIILSHEHEDYQWVSKEDISKIHTDFNVSKWLDYIKNESYRCSESKESFCQ